MIAFMIIKKKGFIGCKSFSRFITLSVTNSTAGDIEKVYSSGSDIVESTLYSSPDRPVLIEASLFSFFRNKLRFLFVFISECFVHFIKCRFRIQVPVKQIGFIWFWEKHGILP